MVAPAFVLILVLVLNLNINLLQQRQQGQNWGGRRNPMPCPMLQMSNKLLRRCKSLMMPAVKQTSPFLDLPIDIHHIIWDELPLPAKILLSQSCKAMWYTLRSKCSLQYKNLFRAERLDVLTELGTLLPESYFCVRCKILHPVEPDDIPDLTKHYNRRHPCRVSRQNFEALRPQGSYKIMFHHVQLALKYSRMKEMYHKCHINILKKFEIPPDASPIIKAFTAEPKVVNARFILSATYVLYADPVRDAVNRNYKHYVMFCPHHHFGFGPGITAVVQKAAIQAAATRNRYKALFSCDRCPTDFSLQAEVDEVIVRAWHDLGCGFSVEDSSWQKHLFLVQNGIYDGVPFNYEHGSISKMYDTCHNLLS